MKHEAHKNAAPESVKALILKVHALTIQGVGGEADSASRKLSMLLSKHGITLEDVMTDTVKTYKFTFRDAQDESLQRQLYYAITRNRESKIWRFFRQNKKVARQIGLDFTAEQYMDFQEQLPHYRDIWGKERTRLFAAFCHKHELLRPADLDAGELPDMKQMEEYLRIKQMMRGLGEKTYFKPAALLSR